MKQKICKGINRAKGYQGCGRETPYRTFGLCASCLWDWMSSNENGMIYKAKVFEKKVKSNLKQEQKKKDKEFKEKNKTITQRINETRVVFQKWIRRRDANFGCISCGTTTSEIWDAGHYFKAELYTGLIFDEQNVHKQCRKCNAYLGGNEINYRKGLISRYGIDYVQELENKANINRIRRFTREELTVIKEKYKKKLKKV